MFRSPRSAAAGLSAVLLFFVIAAATPGAQAPEVDALLRDTDRARGGVATGITWTTTVEADEDGRTSVRTFLVKARGDDALVESLAPARHKGETMLFNDRVIWFVKPGLRRPVSISARQRLSGDAANGDIASTNYARDYEGVLEGEETLGGEPTYRLALKARSKQVTYDRITYWVAKRRRLAVKAAFLTVGGDVFKTATFEYGNTLASSGGPLPFVSRMTITDATGAGTVTRITFDQPRAETHAPSLFNINNVLR